MEQIDRAAADGRWVNGFRKVSTTACEPEVRRAVGGGYGHGGWIESTVVAVAKIPR